MHFRILTNLKQNLSKYILWFVTGIILTFIVNYFSFVEPVRHFYDFVVWVSGRNKPNKEIMMVLVRENFYEKFNTEWPIPIRYITDFLKIMKKEKPKIVGINFTISESSDYKRAEIEELCSISKSDDSVIYSTDFGENEFPIELPRCLQTDKIVLNSVIREGPYEKEYLKYAREGRGYFDEMGKRYFYLDMIMAEKYLNKSLLNNKWISDYYYILFAGPKNTYPSIDFVDLLSGTYSPGIFTNKIVLLGRGDTLAHGHHHKTPFYKKSEQNFSMTTTEIRANNISTLISEKRIIKAPNKITLFLMVISSVLTLFLVMLSTPLKGIIFVMTEFFILLLIPVFFLKFFNIYINVFQPILTLFIAYYFFIPYRLVIEYKKRWQMEEKIKIIDEVEKLKNNFLSLISHNFKTPIARIHGLAESAKYNENLNDNQKKIVDVIIQSAEELLSYVNKILKVVQLEAKGVKIVKASKDINRVILESLGDLSYIAEKKQIKFEKDLEPLFPTKFDSDLIKQVIINIVENAIKYSDNGGVVKIVSKEIDGWINISVIDSGPGIPQNEQNKIFEKFYRIKNDQREILKGSGLGLYLAKYFVELHNGKIEVISKTGEGSTFTIMLPINLE